MKSNEVPLIHKGILIEDDTLTLGQLCQACGVHADWVISLVEESIIEPQGDEIRNWRFSGASLKRVRSALRLEQDLAINLAGVAVVLNLLEELEELRKHIKQITNQ
jgi:chaperone modulatory protein CbpM